MSIEKDEMFFPVLCSRLTNLAKKYELDNLEVCAAWSGENGDYSDTRNLTLRKNQIPASLNNYQNSILNSKQCGNSIKATMLSQIDQIVSDLAMEVIIDVNFLPTESMIEDHWF